MAAGHGRFTRASRWALIAVGLLVALALTVMAIGYALPVAHTAHRSVVLKAAPSVLWATIADVGAYPAWRADVDAVEILPPVDGRPSWRETGTNGAIAYTMTVVEPPTRLVSRIADDDLPFGGEWQYEITPVDRGSRVAIIERGEIYNPVFRVVSRFVLGHTSTIDAYLVALGARFGEDVVPTTPGGVVERGRRTGAESGAEAEIRISR